MKIRKILVPVDFSAYSDKALEFALLWGEKFGAELTLLHVNTLFHEHFDYERLAQDSQKTINQHEHNIQQWIKEHAHSKSDRKTRINYEVVKGASAPSSILQFITGNKFDLVIMGTHGHTGLKHLFLGSVAEKVTRLSPVPVITVHRSLDNYAIKKILAPVDFSEFSRPLVENAIAIAKTFDARIHLMHVLERPMPTSFNWLVEEVEPYFELDPEMRERISNTMQSYVDESVRERVIEVIETGRAYEAIIDYARENKIDLIVMSTRGFSKFNYFWLWGSTTERVVRLAPCSVMTERSANMDQLSEIVFAEDADLNYK